MRGYEDLRVWRQSIGTGRKRLPDHREFPEARGVRSHLTAQKRGDVDTAEHCGRAGSNLDRGVAPVPGPCERLTLRGADDSRPRRKVAICIRGRSPHDAGVDGPDRKESRRSDRIRSKKDKAEKILTSYQLPATSYQLPATSYFTPIAFRMYSVACVPSPKPTIWPLTMKVGVELIPTAKLRLTLSRTACCSLFDL